MQKNLNTDSNDVSRPLPEALVLTEEETSQIRELETNELDLVSGGQDPGVIDLPLGCGSSIRLFIEFGSAMYIPPYPDKCPS